MDSFMKTEQIYERQPRLQGEHSHTVGGNVKGFHSSGVRAGSYVSVDPTCFGVGCKQATLILNIPDLKREQMNINGNIHATPKKIFIIFLSPINLPSSK